MIMSDGWKGCAYPMCGRLMMCVAAAALVFVGTARADTITQFPGNTFPNATGILVAEGVNAAGFENTLEYWTVPAGMTQVNFELLVDIGDYLFTFGFFNTADVATAVGANATYGAEAIGDGTVVFSEHAPFSDTVGATVSFPVTPGDVLGVYLIPNSSAANFLANPGDYYPEPGYPETLIQIAGGPGTAPIFWGEEHEPMFGDDAANYDTMDQLLSFNDGDRHVLIWEDLSRSPDFAAQEIITGINFPVVVPGEIDFDDLAIEMTFTPEPTSLALLGLCGTVLYARRRQS